MVAMDVMVMAMAVNDKDGEDSDDVALLQSSDSGED